MRCEPYHEAVAGLAHARMESPIMNGPGILYTRELPGGGYVVIESLPSEDSAVYRARVSVERRSDPTRRAGHPPPIIAELSGTSRTSVFDELYRIASDNVE